MNAIVKKQIIKSLPFLAIILISTACSPQNSISATETVPPPTKQLATPKVEVNTYTPTPSNTPTNTPLPPTATNTPTQTNTPTNTPTNTLTPTQVNITYENAIFIYFIHPNTGGPVGCGDSLVPLTIGQIRSGDVVRDMTIALNALFSAGQYSGALINTTYTSNLHVNSIDFDKYTGLAKVYMTGSFTKPKNNCDKSRYRAQVWATAKQFQGVKRAEIWVDSKLLGDLLVASSKGN